MEQRRVVILLSQLWDERSSLNKRARADALAYIEQKGWSAYGDPETLTVQRPLLAGGEPNAIFSTLPAGTIAVCPTLDHLAASASDLRDGLFRVIGSGVELHVCELGPVSEKLEPLMRGLSFSVATEQKLQEADEAHEQSEAEWSALFEQYKRDLFGRMVAKFGVPSDSFGAEDFMVPSLLAAENKAGSRAPVAVAEEPEDCKPLGAYVRALRESLDWKQPMLASALDVSISVVSRMESSGKSPHLLDAIRILAGQEEADTFAMLSPAGRVLLAEKRAAELERANAGKLPIWTPEQIAAVPAA